MFQWPHFPSLIVRGLLLLFYLLLLVNDQGTTTRVIFFADLHAILTVSLGVIADNNREVLKALGDNYRIFRIFLNFLNPKFEGQ